MGAEKTNWTPGPWLAASKPSSIVGLPIVQARVGRSIGHVTLGPRSETFADFNVESQANARLISAAPDLYSALALFLEDERFQVAVGGNPLAVEEMLATARAALAKARGDA